jgi:hypothetical protein
MGGILGKSGTREKSDQREDLGVESDRHRAAG